MSDHWLFDTLISVDGQHQELLRGFCVLLLIPFTLFLLSYVRVSFAFIKDRARDGALDTVTRVLAAGLGPHNIRVNSIAPAASRPKGCMRRASSAEFTQRPCTRPRRLSRSEAYRGGN